MKDHANYVAVAAGRTILTKILPLLAMLLMILHIFRPLGLPGLRRRADFWKIAIAMILLTLLAAALQHK